MSSHPGFEDDFGTAPAVGRNLTVSVVMATYQGERYLSGQLQSLIDQTRRPDELVVSDDASTDGTWDILTSFAASAPFSVRVYRNETRTGWVENFFIPFRQAAGVLVAFADQDDVWLPSKLERMVLPLRDPDVQLVVCSSVATDEELRPFNRRRRTGMVSRALLAGPLISPPGNCMLGRRDLLDRLPSSSRPLSLSGPSESHHDEWMLFAAQCFGRVVYVREPLVLYRRHADTVTTSRAEQPRRRWLDPPAAEELEHHVNVCRSRARFVSLAARTADAGALKQQAARYRRLEGGLEHRLEIAAAPTRTRRVTRLIGGLVGGRYANQRRGGLGWLALIQDARWIIQTQPLPPAHHQGDQHSRR